MFPFGSQKPKYRNRYAYDSAAIYQTHDFVWFTESGIDYRYTYYGRNPITNVAPNTSGSGWVRSGDLTETPLRGLQGIQGIIGPEPSDARLNALISQQVLLPPDSQLNSLISPLLASAIIAMRLQNDTQVHGLISTDLQVGGYIPQPSIQTLINQAVQNLIDSNGLIVEFSEVGGTDDENWHRELASYRYIGLRGLDPTQPRIIIDLANVVANQQTLTQADVNTLIAAALINYRTSTQITAEIEARFTDAEKTKLANALTSIPDNAVTTDKVQDGAITTAKVADGAITTPKLGADAVTSANIGDDQIGAEHLKDALVDTIAIASEAITSGKVADSAIITDKLADSAVTTNKIDDRAISLAKMATGTPGKVIGYDASGNPQEQDPASVGTVGDGSITTVKLANDAVTDAKLADDAVGPEHVKDGAIDTVHIAADAITRAKVADAAIGADELEDGAVTAPKLAAGVVVASHITDGEITTAKIADSAITTAKINNRAVTLAKIQTGTANKFLGWNASGEPAELDAPIAGTVADGAITTAKVASNAITNPKIADNAITTGKVIDGAITTSKVADTAITTAKVANDAITTAKLADSSVTNSKLANNSITNGKIADNAVDTAQIADSAVDTDRLAAGAVTQAKIANDAVGTSKIANDAVTLDKLSSGTAGKVIGYDASGNPAELDQSTGGGGGPLVDGSVTTAKLANSAVTSTKINDGSVLTDKIADGAVTNAKLADDSVNTDQIVDDAVTNAKVADNAVDTAQLAPLAVETDKINSGAVTTPKIADSAVISHKIANNAVETAKINNDAVTNAKLADNAVNTSQIVDDAVTADKLADGAVGEAQLEHHGFTDAYKNKLDGLLDVSRFEYSYTTNRILGSADPDNEEDRTIDQRLRTLSATYGVPIVVRVSASAKVQGTSGSAFATIDVRSADDSTSYLKGTHNHSLGANAYSEIEADAVLPPGITSYKIKYSRLSGDIVLLQHKRGYEKIAPTAEGIPLDTEGLNSNNRYNISGTQTIESSLETIINYTPSISHTQLDADTIAKKRSLRQQILAEGAFQTDTLSTGLPTLNSGSNTWNRDVAVAEELRNNRTNAGTPISVYVALRATFTPTVPANTARLTLDVMNQAGTTSYLSSVSSFDFNNLNTSAIITARVNLPANSTDTIKIRARYTTGDDPVTITHVYYAIKNEVFTSGAGGAQQPADAAADVRGFYKEVSYFIRSATTPTLTATDFSVNSTTGVLEKASGNNWSLLIPSGTEDLYEAKINYSTAGVAIRAILKHSEGLASKSKLDANTFIQEKRGKHSEKPHAFRILIEKYNPNMSKIELFARQRFPGWDAWGNEV